MLLCVFPKINRISLQNSSFKFRVYVRLPSLSSCLHGLSDSVETPSLGQNALRIALVRNSSSAFHDIEMFDTCKAVIVQNAPGLGFGWCLWCYDYDVRFWPCIFLLKSGSSDVSFSGSCIWRYMMSVCPLLVLLIVPTWFFSFFKKISHDRVIFHCISETNL